MGAGGNGGGGVCMCVRGYVWGVWGCGCVAVGVGMCVYGCVCGGGVCVCSHVGGCGCARTLTRERGKECVRVPSTTHEKQQMGRIIKPEIKIPATHQIRTRCSPC